MIFNVLQAMGLGNNAVKTGDRQAVVRQTELEHQDLLDYKTLPDWNYVSMMPPGPQKEAAIQALKVKAANREAMDPRWWEDQTPRRPVTQSSSFIQGVQYDPSSKVMNVLMNGKMHSAAGVEPREVTELVDAASMGQTWNQKYRR